MPRPRSTCSARRTRHRFRARWRLECGGCIHIKPGRGGRCEAHREAFFRPAFLGFFLVIFAAFARFVAPFAISPCAIASAPSASFSALSFSSSLSFSCEKSAESALMASASMETSASASTSTRGPLSALRTSFQVVHVAPASVRMACEAKGFKLRDCGQSVGEHARAILAHPRSASRVPRSSSRGRAFDGCWHACIRRRLFVSSTLAQ